MLIFVNGILQPPGGNNSYVAFSDKINFSEAPDIGSEFVGYYVGKLRQMDDISSSLTPCARPSTSDVKVSSTH